MKRSFSRYEVRAHLAIEETSMRCDKGKPLCNPPDQHFMLVKFGKPNLKERAKVECRYTICQSKRSAEVMDVVPLPVLLIARVKNWYVIFMKKNKTIQKSQVLNLQIFMHQRIRILNC